MSTTAPSQTEVSQKESTGARILLVGGSSPVVNAQAIMLTTHGYDVETASNASEARIRWQSSRPDLVLLALSDNADGNFGLWQSIREADPAQRVGFLLNSSQNLCRVFLNGEVILRAEGSDDIIERVQKLLGGD